MTVACSTISLPTRIRDITVCARMTLQAPTSSRHKPPQTSSCHGCHPLVSTLQLDEVKERQAEEARAAQREVLLERKQAKLIELQEKEKKVCVNVCVFVRHTQRERERMCAGRGDEWLWLQLRAHVLSGG